MWEGSESWGWSAPEKPHCGLSVPEGASKKDGQTFQQKQ